MAGVDHQKSAVWLAGWLWLVSVGAISALEIGGNARLWLVSIIRNRRYGWLAGLGWCQSAAICALEIGGNARIWLVSIIRNRRSGWLGLVGVGWGYQCSGNRLKR